MSDREEQRKGIPEKRSTHQKISQYRKLKLYGIQFTTPTLK